MQLWSPPHDRPHLLEWWRPLLLAGERARRRRVPWPIHLDEFRLAGRVVRNGRPDVWIYEHHANGGSLCVDVTGTTYRFIPTPGAKGVGQFRPCDIRSAVWRAGLPDVVEPVRYDERRRRAGAPLSWETGTEPLADDVDLREVSGGASPVVRQRGHLAVIDGGR
jgi:hypothetical protein